jgi:hypothetical protein
MRRSGLSDGISTHDSRPSAAGGYWIIFEPQAVERTGGSGLRRFPTAGRERHTNG